MPASVVLSHAPQQSRGRGNTEERGARGLQARGLRQDHSHQEDPCQDGCRRGVVQLPHLWGEKKWAGNTFCSWLLHGLMVVGRYARGAGQVRDQPDSGQVLRSGLLRTAWQSTVDPEPPVTETSPVLRSPTLVWCSHKTWPAHCCKARRAQSSTSSSCAPHSSTPCACKYQRARCAAATVLQPQLIPPVAGSAQGGPSTADTAESRV